MTVIVPHHKTKDEAIRLVDSRADHLFEIPGGGAIQLTDQKKSWNGSTMDFSLTGRMGFIAVPITGTVVVDDTNVTVNIDLPAMASGFLGEDKIRAGVEGSVRGMLKG
jgi:hypothetical protein